MTHKNLFILILLLSFFFLSESKPRNKRPPKPQETTNNDKPKKSIQEVQKDLNMTMDDMDKIMYCTIVADKTMKKEEDEIEEISNKLKLKMPKYLYDKIYVNILKECINTDIKTVHKYMNNLTYIESIEWDKTMDKYKKINKDKYKYESDLKMTKEENLLWIQFTEVNELFKNKREEEREYLENENRKIRIANIDLEKFPQTLKIALLLGFIIVFFGFIIYYLMTLMKKPKNKKNKEKKKKT